MYFRSWKEKCITRVMNCLGSKPYYFQVLSKIQSIFFCLVKDKKCSLVELYLSKTRNDALNRVQKKNQFYTNLNEKFVLVLTPRCFVLPLYGLLTLFFNQRDYVNFLSMIRKSPGARNLHCSRYFISPFAQKGSCNSVSHAKY